MTCASSEDSDQPGHTAQPFKVFSVHFMDSLEPNTSSCGKKRLLLDWVNAQANLSLRCGTFHFVGFVMRWLKFIILTHSYSTEADGMRNSVDPDRLLLGIHCWY